MSPATRNIIRGICQTLIWIEQSRTNDLTDKQRDRVLAAYRRLMLVLREG